MPRVGVIGHGLRHRFKGQNVVHGQAGGWQCFAGIFANKAIELGFLGIGYRLEACRIPLLSLQICTLSFCYLHATPCRVKSEVIQDEGRERGTGNWELGTGERELGTGNGRVVPVAQERDPPIVIFHETLDIRGHKAV